MTFRPFFGSRPSFYWESSVLVVALHFLISRNAWQRVQQKACKLATSIRGSRSVTFIFLPVSQGPFLIGLAINIFLHGLATTQVYLYFTGYKKDKLWLKSLIAILYLADTFNCIVSIYYIYSALVIHFGASLVLPRRYTLIFRTPVCNPTSRLQGVVSVAVQLFFAWRAHVLTKNVFIVATIILCSLASLAGSLGCAISLAANPSIFLVPDLRVEVTIWLVGAVLADTIIAASLVWHLGRHRSFYPAVNSTINRILRMTVQTGVLTTIIAIIDLTCYLTNSMGTYAIFSMILSKLYTNCMLSTLNARKARKYVGSSEDEVSHGRSNHPGASTPTRLSQRTYPPQVFVQVESHQLTDMDDKPSQGVEYL
ncbi:hypothetical protein PISMIDRAFT_106430 [Pisolithus microcarpus 441]|uniref:DUF6534 domain-containing protein n=1 Tax=Pisolithus microcarpus 441 TaxID=765257 RepID=A0A0C9YTP5_9AGAM|nr:hypothetical protein PISMIDRAFT_106430 [Pisolithus microcarpus 441]